MSRFLRPAAVAGAPLLAVSDLTVTFPTDSGDLHAVRGVNWSVEEGRVLGIVGESGSGKSVTAMAIMGLLPKTARVSGSVLFEGVDLLALPDRDRNTYRGNNIAMVFQDPMTSLNPVYSIGWQLAEAVLIHHPVSKKAARRRAIELLEIVGIPNPAERVDNYPHEYSGGMRQRAVIAMAMANDPEVIIADEPTTALDVTVQAQVLEALERARQATHAAMVLITHDLGVVAGSADEVAVMYAGRVVEHASCEDVYYEPRMPYTLGLLGSLPRVDDDGSRRLTPIVGVPPIMVGDHQGCPFVPRCPMATLECAEVEPPLTGTDRPDHTAACHRKGDLVKVQDATDVFDPTAGTVGS